MNIIKIINKIVNRNRLTADDVEFINYGCQQQPRSLADTLLVMAEAGKRLGIEVEFMPLHESTFDGFPPGLWREVSNDGVTLYSLVVITADRDGGILITSNYGYFCGLLRGIEAASGQEVKPA